MAASQADTKKSLALAIIDFIQASAKDGTISAEDQDSVDVAVQGIADCFQVDASAAKSSPDAQSLLQIYKVYENLRGKTTASTQGASSAAEGRPATPQTPGASSSGPSSGTKNAEAENLKGQGNVAMQQKDYAKAIQHYSAAIDIQPTNPIYLSNRAAAYSATSQHEMAKQDAEMAVASDPKYTKAWSRLGLARYALGDAKGSMEAYKAGIDAEGNGGSDAMKKGYETARRKVEADGDLDDVAAPREGGGAGGMPDLASMLGGMGGGSSGAGGGMPDFGQIMQNPMFRNMAQNIMSNPDMMSNLMNNPQLRQMAESFGGGGGGRGGQGGMPDLSSLMSDPSIAEMARNFMGPQGGQGQGRGAGRGT